MADERVFTVQGSDAVRAEPIDLAAAGLRERSDLQEWVLNHPDILGPGVMVVTFEFDRWQNSVGERQHDRLDVLGIDTDGRIVIAELKRDRAPDTVHMQAVKYAAMASRFTEDDLVAQYATFLTRQTGNPVIEPVARERLIEHAGELDPEQLRQPKIVLVAGAFTPVTTASVVWLTEMGLDITMQRVQAYRVAGGQIVVTVSQMFPIPDVEEFTVSPQRADAQSAKSRRRGTREKSTVARLVAAKLLEDGTPLVLVPTSEISSDVRQLVDDWLAQDPRRARAAWRNDRAKPLIWEYDGRHYRPTEIVRTVLSEAAGIERSVRGPAWWRLEDGRDLPSIAGGLQKGGFDWSGLHLLMSNLPPGQWTTYGDLASTVGTAPQPLGTHIMQCNECLNPARVLGADGRPSPGFTWGDTTRTETQQDVLEKEGVQFIGGRADPDKRIPLARLQLLVSDDE